GAVALARVERIHNKPFRICGARKIDDLLKDVVVMASNHPIVIRQIAKLQFERAGENGMDMNLEFREPDVHVGFTHRTRYREFVKCNWPVDLVHVEWRVLERAKFRTSP